MFFPKLAPQIQEAKQTNAPVKVDFNAIPVPKNYVAGMGRGATGFTTRSDIGPAKAGASLDGGEAAAAGPKPEGPDDQKFDEFLGNDAGVFANSAFGEYDKDDEEADAIWNAVDERMDERRRVQREKRLQEEIEKYRLENPKITEQFADLKRKLGTMSEADWESIPEIGDYSIKNKKRQTFAAVPDNLLASAAQSTTLDTKAASLSSGLDSVAGGMTTDLTAVGKGRDMVVRLKLDSMADSVSGQTVVDPKGYLTDLKNVKLANDAEVSDIKKARLLMKSITSTNPKHAPGWIGAARVEEVAGRLAQARQLIAEGCEHCPHSEDVWLEAARLQTPENAKAVLARGVAALPNSVKLWIQAAKLEVDAASKSRVLRKALERVPTSVRLWKACVELANEDDARVLLSRAVECCPQHVELWLALAKLESYENARKVLNKARQAIPTDATIWITAAKLEESQGNGGMVDKIIARGIKSLQANSVVIEREWWMKQAEDAERAQPPLPLTCRAIVAAVIDVGVEDEDRRRTYKADAEECLKRGSAETARAIYAHALQLFPGKKGLWRRAAMLEKTHGTREALEALLKKAVTYCPQAEVLWLMAAKEAWLGGEVDKARNILSEAFAANPDNEDIWLAAFKLEFENEEPERARMILQKARDTETASTRRVWMKSAMVEREMGNTEGERVLLRQGLEKFPDYDKLHLMLGQLEERQGNIQGARAAYTEGVKRCPNSIPLWTSAAALEERAGAVGKARALLEQARLRNPQNPDLWLAAARVELRAGNTKAAGTVMAKALQECPASGRLWAEQIMLAPRPQRRARSVDALKACDNDPHVMAAVAMLFWVDRKVDKARNWFNRAVTLDSDMGDHWAQYYRFEVQHGTPEQQAEVVKRCVAADPRHGEKWTAVSKNPANAHKDTEAVLKEVAAAIGREERQSAAAAGS